MNPVQDIWIAFLVNLYCRKAIELACLTCPGCRRKPVLKSPLLHKHHHQSLLDKLREHSVTIRTSLLGKLDKLLDQVAHKLPINAANKDDRTIYLDAAKMFLHISDVDSIYYGKLLNDNNDTIISELTTPPKKRKTESVTETSSKQLTQTLSSAYQQPHLLHHVPSTSPPLLQQGFQTTIPQPQTSSLSPEYQSQVETNDLWELFQSHS